MEEVARDAALGSPDRPGAAIATRRLAKSFGAERALAGIDLDVPEGAVCLLAGANGALP